MSIISMVHLHSFLDKFWPSSAPSSNGAYGGDVSNGDDRRLRAFEESSKGRHDKEVEH
jgi:hypothetical protein